MGVRLQSPMVPKPPNLAVVHATRGLRNQAAAQHEEALEEVIQLLERLRVKQSNPRSDAIPKVLTLPTDFKDWYLARNLENPQWRVQSDGDEKQLHAKVARLHQLGIPTFLREERPPSLMKLFVSLEAHVLDASLPAESEKAAFWSSLHDGLTRLVVAGMAEVALELFGSQAGSNLVAVFRASGYSIAARRWKASLRVNFLELAVTLDTARRARDLLIERLAATSSAIPREGWAASLAAIDRGGATADTADGLSCSMWEQPQSFWARVVDERAFETQAQYRLVWCDVAHGDLLLPEERPLLPHALLLASARRGGGVEQRREEAQELPAGDWVRLGSPWTPLTAATAFWSQSDAGQERALARAPGELLSNGWTKHYTPAGAAYYQRPGSRETFWQIPAEAPPAPPPAVATAPSWISYKTQDGQVYYWNRQTNTTHWTLPEGAAFAESR